MFRITARTVGTCVLQCGGNLWDLPPPHVLSLWCSAFFSLTGTSAPPTSPHFTTSLHLSSCPYFPPCSLWIPWFTPKMTLLQNIQFTYPSLPPHFPSKTSALVKLIISSTPCLSLRSCMWLKKSPQFIQLCSLSRACSLALLPAPCQGQASLFFQMTIPYLSLCCHLIWSPLLILSYWPGSFLFFHWINKNNLQKTTSKSSNIPPLVATHTLLPGWHDEYPTLPWVPLMHWSFTSCLPTVLLSRWVFSVSLLSPLYWAIPLSTHAYSLVIFPS